MLHEKITPSYDKVSGVTAVEWYLFGCFGLCVGFPPHQPAHGSVPAAH